MMLTWSCMTDSLPVGWVEVRFVAIVTASRSSRTKEIESRGQQPFDLNRFGTISRVA